MVRKAVFLAGGLGLLCLMLSKTDAVSYAWTSATKVKDSVRSNVPVEFEIERARQMVADLEPDIRRNMHVIAKEEVEIDRLEKQIAMTEDKLAGQRTDIVRLQTDLSAGKGVYRYAGRRYKTSQVKADLANRFERFKTNEATLGSLQDILTARQRSLAAARQKLEGMMAAKRKLAVEVENLEARLKMVEVAQTTSDYQFDDSQLARVKNLMTEIHTRLGVAEKLVNSDHQYQGEIMLDAPETENIMEQVAEYFELDRPQAERLAEAVH